MSKATTARADARPQDVGFHNHSGGRVAGKSSTIKSWSWHDPPILFPVFIILLIVGYAVVRMPP
jgi:hypothetical protein